MSSRTSNQSGGNRLLHRKYAVEFKLNGDADEALQQVKNKHYVQPYFHSGKVCIGIGLNFSKELKKAEKLVWEEIN